jgi:hypothetical protein
MTYLNNGIRRVCFYGASEVPHFNPARIAQAGGLRQAALIPKCRRTDLDAAVLGGAW